MHLNCTFWTSEKLCNAWFLCRFRCITVHEFAQTICDMHLSSSQFETAFFKWAMSWDNLFMPFMPYANSKGTDQPAHPRSLISVFIVCCLYSMISLLFIAEISRLASLCSWAGWFESYLVGNPDDRFFRDEAQILCMQEYSLEHMGLVKKKCVFRSLQPVKIQTSLRSHRS